MSCTWKTVLIAVILVGGCAVGTPAAGQAGTTATDSREPVSFKGTIHHADTGAPLAGAHVFLAGTTIGTATNDNGSFSFRTQARGAHRLYITMMGYEPIQRDLMLEAGTTHTLHITLTPTTLELDTVVVGEERTGAWWRKVDRFTEMFIGTSARADSVKLLNPEVLRFNTSWWGPFRARAVTPLTIENRALGYRIRYHLEEFEARGTIVRWDGEPFFELMEPASEEQADRWKANREEAFYGSFRHFMLALLYDRIREEGFTMHRKPNARHRIGSNPMFRATASKIATQNAPDSTFALSFRGRLIVKYHDAPESSAFVAWRGGSPHRARRYQPSKMELNHSTVEIDRFGKSVEPYTMTVYEYFAFQRVADLVPLGYLPEAYGDESPFPRRPDLYVRE